MSKSINTKPIKKGRRLKTVSPPSIADRQRFSQEHLYYEITMLYDMALRLRTNISETYLANALIESFVIHSALLIDFLSNERKWTDDCIVGDYVKDPAAWNKHWDIVKDKFKFILQRRHKEAAHLSYERLNITFLEKQWHFVAIARELSDQIDLFLDAGDATILTENVRKLRGVYRNYWKGISDFDSLPMRPVPNIE